MSEMSCDHTLQQRGSSSHINHVTSIIIINIIMIPFILLYSVEFILKHI